MSCIVFFLAFRRLLNAVSRNVAYLVARVTGDGPPLLGWGRFLDFEVFVQFFYNVGGERFHHLDIML